MHAESRSTVLLAAILLPLLASAGAESPSAGPPPRRELKRRPLRLTDANATAVPEIHVAGGVPTTVVFRSPIKPDSVLIADTSGLFPEKTRTTSTSLLLIPRADLPQGTVATLSVTLTDGTILPFLLSSVPSEADLQVDVEVALEEHAPPESTAGMKTVISQLQQKLDECTASSGAAGVQKIAALIVQQDLARPQAFQRYDVRKLDKQSRLLVEVRQAYRLFGTTYVVMTIENRDPSRSWVLDHPEVALQGGGRADDLKVSSFSGDMPALHPDETQKLVIAFPTPAQGINNRFVLSLKEKDGNRHVRLEDVAL
jgi:uncharacterized protein (TIGR02268 family)